MHIEEAIAELRPLNEPVPKPAPLPTEADVSAAERLLGLEFPADFRRYLLEASDVVYGTKEPCQIAPGRYRAGPISGRGSFKFGLANPREERVSRARAPRPDRARKFGLVGS